MNILLLFLHRKHLLISMFGFDVRLSLKGGINKLNGFVSLRLASGETFRGGVDPSLIPLLFVNLSFFRVEYFKQDGRKAINLRNRNIRSAKVVFFLHTQIYFHIIYYGIDYEQRNKQFWKSLSSQRIKLVAKSHQVLTWGLVWRNPKKTAGRNGQGDPPKF